MSLPAKLVFDGLCSDCSVLAVHGSMMRYATRLMPLVSQTRNGNIYMVLLIINELAADHKVGLHIDKRGTVRYVE